MEYVTKIRVNDNGTGTKGRVFDSARWREAILYFLFDIWKDWAFLHTMGREYALKPLSEMVFECSEGSRFVIRRQGLRYEAEFTGLKESDDKINGEIINLHLPSASSAEVEVALAKLVKCQHLDELVLIGDKFTLRLQGRGRLLAAAESA